MTPEEIERNIVAERKMEKFLIDYCDRSGKRWVFEFEGNRRQRLAFNKFLNELSGMGATESLTIGWNIAAEENNKFLADLEIIILSALKARFPYTPELPFGCWQKLV